MLKNLDNRWLALIILCLGDLMIILDTTIVNVALPSIKTDLGFTETSLVWVINAYMLTFSGFLLLGGRLGDLFGQKKIFLIGLALFTLASLACGLANTQTLLITARSIQGIGGAIVSAVALSLIMNLFSEPADRAKAMGFFGFVAAGGGAIGVFLGGLLTGAFDWHWNFLVNIPIGIAVFILSYSLLPRMPGSESSWRHIDFMGAITITGSLMLTVYAIVNGNTVGWLTTQTLGIFAAAIVLFIIFFFIEKNIQHPLVPLGVFTLGNVSIVSVIGILWSAAMFSWFFLSALYMQIILGYDPLWVGLAFLPSNLIMAAFSLGLSARIVMRYGTKFPLTIGMIFIAAGLFLFALAPSNGTILLHVMPGMLLLGVGVGLAFNPVLLAGTSDIPQEESGLVSGVLNTAFMMGGSLGLAILASLAASRTESLIGTLPQNEALLSGYHLAFFAGAMCALVAAALAFFKLRKVSSTAGAAVH